MLLRAIPAWMVVIIVAGVAAVSLTIAWAVASSGGELDETRDALAAAESEVARLERQVADTEASRQQTADALATAEGQLEELNTQLTSEGTNLQDLEAERASLQQQLEETQASSEELQAQVTQSTEQIALLNECLNGTRVALAFSIEGSDDLATRAREAVADSCAAVE